MASILPSLNREDRTLVAWYRYVYAPRAGGAYDSHHRTAGIAADKISGFEECDDCFLTLFRYNRDFDPAFPNVEDGIRGLTLGEDDLTLSVLG